MSEARGERVYVNELSAALRRRKYGQAYQLLAAENGPLTEEGLTLKACCEAVFGTVFRTAEMAMQMRPLAEVAVVQDRYTTVAMQRLALWRLDTLPPVRRMQRQLGDPEAPCITAFDDKAMIWSVCTAGNQLARQALLASVGLSVGSGRAPYLYRLCQNWSLASEVPQDFGSAWQSFATTVGLPLVAPSICSSDMQALIVRMVKLKRLDIGRVAADFRRSMTYMFDGVPRVTRRTGAREAQP